MARKKQYNEEEVIDRAMNLFWRNGYESTSMQMLEKEMGINKFSIYSSFGSKNGVLTESIKLYQKKLNVLINTLKTSLNGTEGIKQYFYDFVEFTKGTDFGKGCLMTSTMNELGASADEKIMELSYAFSKKTNQAFYENLSQDSTKGNEVLQQQTDFLIMSLLGLTFATRMFNKEQLENYIEHIFKKI